MRLSTLLPGLHSLPALLTSPASIDRDISSLTLDSRAVEKNSLFIAVKGSHSDGREYIPQAISRGAAAILVDDMVNDTQAKTPCSDELSAVSITWVENTPILSIPDLKSKIGKLAARFYNYPAKNLSMIGITGTSGKTSCSHFIAQSLQSLKLPCGIIGTLGSGFYGALGSAGLTTPDPISLQSLLSQFVDQGAKTIAMEVSSHSIDQERISGLEFDIGIFTNLSQDHLDYHGDMASYAAVKRRFIAAESTKHAIINADDAEGRKWIEELSPHCIKTAEGGLTKPITAYATSKPDAFPSHIPLVYAEQVELTLQGIKAHVVTPWGNADIFLPLIGQFNLSNGLAVLTTLCVYGIPFKQAVDCLARLSPVAGRMQTLGGNKTHPLVVVDYAHKPDALEKVLKALRTHTQGKLCCVFGCGGERDRGKRPLMAKIAEEWADHVIVTNDNPRHENPQDIAAEILGGFSHPENISIELDRSKAIQNSIQWASVNDCILIAGKGAEHYQQIGDEKFPFDDVEKVKEYL